MTAGSGGGVFAAAAACLLAGEPADKVRLTEEAARDWRAGRLAPDEGGETTVIDDPGRPERPVLVHPRDLSRRTPAHDRGRAALVHAVAHIEFNAINLAWDAVHRFRGLPVDYYDDWVRVAAEEAYHFGLMRGRLQELGCDYGDFPAHDGLWDMARRTAHDPLVRMALVPRAMEARGLDVTPAMIRRFRSAGDRKTADLLEIILRDEVDHVEAGSRWFRCLCRERGLEPEETYFGLVREFLGGEIRCPLNLEARRRAGFSDRELSRLEELCAGR